LFTKDYFSERYSKFTGNREGEDEEAGAGGL